MVELFVLVVKWRRGGGLEIEGDMENVYVKSYVEQMQQWEDDRSMKVERYESGDGGDSGKRVKLVLQRMGVEG
jgi:hypothetical protein